MTKLVWDRVVTLGWSDRGLFSDPTSAFVEARTLDKLVDLLEALWRQTWCGHTRGVDREALEASPGYVVLAGDVEACRPGERAA